MASGVTIQNRERLKAKARALRNNVAATVTPAVIKAAELIIGTQKRYCPVDDGDLRDSIHWEKSQDSPNATQILIIAGGKPAPHGRIIEFGIQRQPAQPFFFPGYRVERPRAKAIISKAVRIAVRNAAR
jgi:HK97 gp10 family phage protein